MDISMGNSPVDAHQLMKIVISCGPYVILNPNLEKINLGSSAAIAKIQRVSRRTLDRH